jgi:hypothetical protein
LCTFGAPQRLDDHTTVNLERKEKMFASVIAGVDGHTGGWDAIALAERLVEWPRQVTLAHVYANGAHVGKAAKEAADSSRRERAVELLDSVRKQADTGAELIAVAADYRTI